MSLEDNKLTDADIAAHGVRAQPDTLTGSADENKKVFDALIADVLQKKYNATLDQFKTFETNVTNWETAEAVRVTAEKGRVSAETARVTAETARATAETARKTAETARATAETARATAETSRAAAEATRQTNEAERIQNEAARKQAEAERVDAEEKRNTWEVYDHAKTYAQGNKVVYQGSSFLCISESLGIYPTDAAHWRLIAAKGADGIGAGDMLAEMYDPRGIKRDVYAYADAGAEQALTAAKVYADSGAEQALTAAKVYADSVTPTFVYKCTGTADSTAIANIVNDFFENGTAMSMKLIITGTMGIAFTSTYYAIYIDALNTRGARVFLDFSDCYIPEITTASRDLLYIGGGVNVNVFGLVGTVTRFGISCASSSTITFTNCNISGGTYGVVCYPLFAGKLTLNSNCKIIGNTYGVYCNVSNTAAVVKLTDCQIKGGTQDVYQVTAASTMHWLIKGCSFAGANIYVNGATISVSSTVANAYLAIQAYHNLFSQTIS